MRIKTTLLILLLLSSLVFSHAQTRRTKRPARKSSQQQVQPKTDPNAITLLYSENGRNYYLHEVVKKPDSDDLFFSYVVGFDQTTPAGRSALSKMMVLSNLSATDVDQTYYVTAVEYECHFSLKEPNNLQYDTVYWIDQRGNTIAQLQIKREDAGIIKDQVAEISTYSDAYLREVFDALEESNNAQRRLFDASIRLLINTGDEEKARRLKFQPRLPKYVPALSLFISGGINHMSEVPKAAKEIYEKRTRNTN